jgi:hypothetical protein
MGDQEQRPEDVSAALTPGILALRVVCPAGYGEPSETKALGEVLASDHREKALPAVLDNIRKAKFLIKSGVFSEGEMDEALVMTFGGALATDEEGNVIRDDYEEEPISVRPEPALQESKKK